jgi:hypothetical protein
MGEHDPRRSVARRRGRDGGILEGLLSIASPDGIAAAVAAAIVVVVVVAEI